MNGRSARGDPIATRLVCLVIAAVLSGCDEGYPREDLDIARSTASGGAAVVIERLNRMNETSLTETHWEFTLASPCELQLSAEHPDGRDEEVHIELLHSDVQVKGNVGGPVHAVQVDFSGSPQLTDRHLFEAERWTDAVEYATNLQALQRLCAKRR